MKKAILLAIGAAVPMRTPAQTPDTASFVTTQGKDTVAFEQYVRRGNTITGAWIQLVGGLVLVHDYSLVLRNDGWPDRYAMTLYSAKGLHLVTIGNLYDTVTKPIVFSVAAVYGVDSTTRVMTAGGNTTGERVATARGYPVGALSILAMDLALTRASQARTDSQAIILDRIERRGLSPAIAVRFFGTDSVRIGSAVSNTPDQPVRVAPRSSNATGQPVFTEPPLSAWAQLDRQGHLMVLRQGPRETRRVPSFDVAKTVAQFNAASSAASQPRTEIALPAAALESFVGDYSPNPNTPVTVTLDDGKLTLHAGNQPPGRLLALSPTTFFIESVKGVTFTFQTDSAGAVTGLIMTGGGPARLAPKRR